MSERPHRRGREKSGIDPVEHLIRSVRYFLRAEDGLRNAPEYEAEARAQEVEYHLGRVRTAFRDAVAEAIADLRYKGRP